MPKLTASVPHQLTRTEAKRRIQDGLNDLRQKQAALLGGFRENWSGDTMEFHGGVMGQSVSGRLEVEDQAVRVEVALPWLLGMLAGALKPRIEQQGRQLLSAPTSKSSPDSGS
jgi:Putative polyhydroxyalkanoic acid system protein (PHA_gran_rgn)